MDKLRQISLLLVTAVFIFFCIRMVNAYSDVCTEIDADYRSGLSVNLDRNARPENIRKVLLKRGYFTDTADAGLVSRAIVHSLRAGVKLESLYGLRDKSWKIMADSIPAQGVGMLKERVEKTRKIVGVEYVATGDEPSERNLASGGSGRIAVRVEENDTAVSGVLVCLRQHFFDSVGQRDDSVLAVAKTSSSGEVVFKGLDTALSYSVLPFREGYEYGRSKGTIGGTLCRTANTSSRWRTVMSSSLFKRKYEDLEFTFTQAPLRVPLFDDATLRLIHEERAFTLRTPDQWKVFVTRSAALFIACWMVLIFVLWLRRRREAVYWPVAAFMAITGMGLLGMMSYNDPFTDELIAKDYLIGVIVGIVGMVVMQFVDLKKFFRSPRFDPLGSKVYRKGLGWFILALALTLLLFTPFGQSVGGMTVNLKIWFLPKFQPSEITKYLIVVFMSAWFCRKIDTLVGYSEEGNISLLKSKVHHVAGIFIAFFCMLVIYIGLGDMGPGIVLSIAFIIIYSIVKSRSAFKSTGGSFMKGVLKSDIFMLIVGVMSFLLVIWIGGLVHLSGLFAVLWFAIWIGFWYYVKKQLWETPIMANLVISVFLFARNIPGSIGERFALRSEMCSNPWGNLGLDGSIPQPTPNSQVAEGLWGLASGGFCGQGFGHGSPNFIPAFETDMVLSSLGEQIGWLGLLTFVLLLLSVLHHTIAVGYNSRNYFSFFVCLGVAVVTAVQFAIIALGSTGVIPLTGVAVPLLSYGKVSMIMTLVAFGIVLSVETHTFKPRKDNAADQAAENLFLPYDAPVALTRTTGFVFSLFIIGVFAYTMLLHRNSTLVRPLFVTSVSGENLVQYNPRIAEVTNALHPGNIYDRNGLLLATSSPSEIRADEYAPCGVYSDELKETLLRRARRYYPLGDRLLFMVGDLNSKKFSLAYSDASPIGYLAESQHLSYLRGFDNMLYADKEHKKPVRVNIVSDQFIADRYQPAVERKDSNIVVRDYRALLPMLKAGKNSRRIERVNKRKSHQIKPQDIYLTLDAALQCRLQERVADHMKEKHSGKELYNLMRVSVVVLDAQDGDLLASALYPLPNIDTLLAHADEKIYNDSKFTRKQRAYTDRDLGLVYLTAPGSTAKLMTALAALQKVGKSAAQQTFFIPAAELIEPVGKEPQGKVNMKRAIAYSSNCYFIHLMNHLNLYSTLDSIYAATGARVSEDNGKKKKSNSVTPYYLHYAPIEGDRRATWKGIVSRTESEGLAGYTAYERVRAKEPKKMSKGPKAWQWAWGQGTLDASPLGMARVVSAVVNGGVMPKTRYLLAEPREEGIRLVSNESADTLKTYMKTMAEHGNREGGTAACAINENGVGGKTGTPERTRLGINVNDGWFVFYVEGATVRTGDKKEKHPLAVAVRMERGVGSPAAMTLSRDVVLPVLRELGYR